MVEKRKIAIIGAGNVGISVAFALINQNNIGLKEIVLLDVAEEKAKGETLDLAQGVQFLKSSVKVYYGSYSDCYNADFGIITASVSSSNIIKNRLELATENTKLVSNITKELLNFGFNGIFIIATNPVDLMTYVVKKVSDFPREKVIGTGTIIDTARLKYYLSKHYNVSTDNVEAYVLGEHGDSSFALWSHCKIGCENILDLLTKDKSSMTNLHEIFSKVQKNGNEIANLKGNTCFTIAMSIVRIIKAIYLDENIILPVSTYLQGEYQICDTCLGLPCILNQNGIDKVLNIKLNKSEQKKLEKSYNVLSKVKETDVIPYI